ncbi:broad substrate specificity ATP-binding cassette transporter ABCG2-like [Physella acuta]|uniref:broad substrate specificity ATP-binding cassette transporter ABCG2-like n=1 Tax=Physella acuta TaxID=109671 RepID=UPI0027DB9267|nr:broad substrate specificity ATP-binding cassette transporter ABCG2-like [Physella acuta]XP_059165210.1 broad substrate specificity ATP-binding cassette transporter ABCG2-like [Physella acuta]XP_059165211.1 broad substrate specificity ATP-binding cassette transporter ABCG2-like [Physella acuta]
MTDVLDMTDMSAVTDVLDVTSQEAAQLIKVSSSISNGQSDIDQRQRVLSAHHINHTLKVKDKLCPLLKTQKQILFDVSSIFRPGVSAIMGPTGSGKTTLLDILAGRTTPDRGATLLLDGHDVPSNFRFLVGYVVQDDVIMDTLTVRENLNFSASLRLPPSLSAQARADKVTSVIRELHLEKCADHKIGNELIRGVSGGEKKRCNIGMELIISPPVLFLDEPTSGLDSNTASNVLILLKRLASKGRTIILSIHQPRYTAYGLFDHLLLLSHGHVVYDGPTGDTLDYFSSLGYVCPEHQNPADYFLDVINCDVNTIKTSPPHVSNGDSPNHESQNHTFSQSFLLGASSDPSTNHNNTNMDQTGDAMPLVYIEDQEDQRHRRHRELVDAYMGSHRYTTLQRDVKDILSEYQSQNGIRHCDVNYPTSFTHQVSVVARRSLKNLWRNPQTTLITVTLSILFAAMLAVLYKNLPQTTGLAAFKDRSGVIFFLIMNHLFFNMSSVELFINERKLFLQETVSGYYRVSVYFLVKIFFDILPLRLVPEILVCCIVYFSVGLNPGPEHFLKFFLCLLETLLAAAGLCFLISATVRVFAVAQLTLAFCYVLMILLGGFLINPDSIDPWLSWVQYFSLFKYAQNALYINEFQDRMFCTNLTLCKSGNEYLQEQNIAYEQPGDMWSNYAALFVYGLLLHLLTYVQLRRLKKS